MEGGEEGQEAKLGEPGHVHAPIARNSTPPGLAAAPKTLWKFSLGPHAAHFRVAAVGRQ